MNVESVLAARPQLRRPALRVVRCRDNLRLVSLSHSPLFMASHWRGGRSFPCSRDLIGECRLCASSTRRHHAYIAGTINSGNGEHWFRAALETPPEPLLRAIDESKSPDLLGRCLQLNRPHKRGSIQVIIKDEEKPRALAATEPSELIRTLMRLYALPEREDFQTEEAWLLAVRMRVMDKEYTPARSARSPSED